MPRKVTLQEDYNMDIPIYVNKMHEEHREVPDATHIHMKHNGRVVRALKPGEWYQYCDVYPLLYWCADAHSLWTHIETLTIDVTDDWDETSFWELTQAPIPSQATLREAFHGFQVAEGLGWTLWDSIPEYRFLRQLNIAPISMHPAVLLEHMRYLQGETREEVLDASIRDAVRNRTKNVLDLELNLTGFGNGPVVAEYLQATVCTNQACAHTQRRIWDLYERTLPARRERDERAYRRHGGQRHGWRAVVPNPELTCYKEHFSFDCEFVGPIDYRTGQIPEEFGLIRVQLKGIRTVE